MRWAGFAADFVAWAHLAFAAFVVVGFALIVAGAIVEWTWTRNRWFRSAHLAAIVLVTIRCWLQLPCPLTVLEHWLRLRSTAIGPTFNPAVRWAHVGVFAGVEPTMFAGGVTVFLLLTVIAHFACKPTRDVRPKIDSFRTRTILSAGCKSLPEGEET